MPKENEAAKEGPVPIIATFYSISHCLKILDAKKLKVSQIKMFAKIPRLLKRFS